MELDAFRPGGSVLNMTVVPGTALFRVSARYPGGNHYPARAAIRACFHDIHSFLEQFVLFGTPATAPRNPRPGSSILEIIKVPMLTGLSVSARQFLGNRHPIQAALSTFLRGQHSFLEYQVLFWTPESSLRAPHTSSSL